MNKEHAIELGNSIINDIFSGWGLRVKAKRESGVWKKRRKREVENQTGQKVKSLKFDNGREYDS